MSVHGNVSNPSKVSVLGSLDDLQREKKARSLKDGRCNK